MNTIEKIRAEIERRWKDYRNSVTPDQPKYRTHYFVGKGEVCEELLSFLDTLEEQECPEYCVRSHCIGCSKYNPDKWSNKLRKAKVKATGEIVEGFTDGQGHFDVFTDHNVCNRYDVNAIEFDTLEPEEPTLTWGDVQLLDTFILECAREEREGKDWGESEEFYTEVLRRYNDFVKRTIPEIISKIHEYNENDRKDSSEN